MSDSPEGNDKNKGDFSPSGDGKKDSAGKGETTIVTQQAGSNAKDDCSDLTDNNNDNEEQSPKTFPQKLMDILSNDEHSHIISWLPHGNGFVIHKKKTFAAEVLPKYFKASKFTSFTRKLNRWGFSRVPRGPETGSYYHKLFRRDKPEMSLQMTSNSGNKYQHNPAQHLLPNMPGMPGFFPYMTPQMMANMTPQQQQQAMWQQQMQMMQFQMQFQQMQQMQAQAQQASNNQQSSGSDQQGAPMMGTPGGSTPASTSNQVKAEPTGEIEATDV